MIKNIKILSLLLIFFLLSSCSSTKLRPLCEGYITEPNIRYQAAHVSFVAPFMWRSDNGFVYDQFRPNVWKMCSSNKISKIAQTFEFNQTGVDGLWGIISLKLVDYVAIDAKYRKEDKNWKGFLEPDAAYTSSLAKREKENARRAEILSGTLEDHWQKELSKKTVDEMTKNLWIRSESKGRLVPAKTLHKTPEALEAAAKKKFYYHFGLKRQRLMGLPDDSVKKVMINGQRCNQLDRFERLLTPIGEYAKPTSGGFEHDRQYICRFENGFGFDIITTFKIGLGLGLDVDFDRLMKPTLDSIDWHAEVNNTAASSTITNP